VVCSRALARNRVQVPTPVKAVALPPNSDMRGVEGVESEVKYARARITCVLRRQGTPHYRPSQRASAGAAAGQARITREVVPAEGRLGIGGVMGANGRRRVVITGLGAVAGRVRHR
jgi:hypothetical protein